MARDTLLSVSPEQALAWRLDRHLLDPVGGGRDGAPATTAADVVRRLGAVLSMDQAAAELAVRARLRISEPGCLARALAAGEVTRAFVFRGAVHYLAPEDGGVWLSVRCAGRQWQRRSWVDFYRLGPDDWPAFRAAVREALTDGPLTVDELGARVTADRRYRHLAEVFADGAGTLVKPLTWQGDMAIAPSRDGRLTFRRLDDDPRWGGVPALEDAGPRAVLAYLATYGPASLDAVHHWLGGGLSAGRRRLQGWIEGLGDRLAPVDVGGRAAVVPREHLDALAAAPPSSSVRLLPGHDQWVMGPGTKDELVVPARWRDAMTRKAGALLLGGVVRGTWRRNGDRVDVVTDAATLPRGPLRDEVARVLTDADGADLEVVVSRPA